MEAHSTKAFPEERSGAARPPGHPPKQDEPDAGTPGQRSAGPAAVPGAERNRDRSPSAPPERGDVLWQRRRHRQDAMETR
ncbi:hypothetical protein GCM10027440_52750 [Nocardiopsis coralliicola]